jgi:DNA-nicking Smr family endonuclease
VAARRKLGEFLTRSRDEQHQCVLVVSGRGTHSNGEAVLQRAVVDWITGPLSRHALAVATAAPKDGGEGAYYVLLRKK